MKFFRLIHQGIDVKPLLEEIGKNEDAWLADTSRQDSITVQRDTNTIYIRGAVKRPDLHVNENQESAWTAIAEKFPLASSFMDSFAKSTNGTLARATIVRLKPRSKVYRHIDMGSYYLIRNRFHLVLRSAAGSVLISGGEQARMKEGELWWFDNKQHHEAYNESEEWRIHYIFDVLPNQLAVLVRNPLPPQGPETDLPPAAHT